MATSNTVSPFLSQTVGFDSSVPWQVFVLIFFTTDPWATPDPAEAYTLTETMRWQVVLTQYD